MSDNEDQPEESDIEDSALDLRDFLSTLPNELIYAILDEVLPAVDTELFRSTGSPTTISASVLPSQADGIRARRDFFRTCRRFAECVMTNRLKVKVILSRDDRTPFRGLDLREHQRVLELFRNARYLEIEDVFATEHTSGTETWVRLHRININLKLSYSQQNRLAILRVPTVEDLAAQFDWNIPGVARHRPAIMTWLHELWVRCDDLRYNLLHPQQHRTAGPETCFTPTKIYEFFAKPLGFRSVSIGPNDRILSHRLAVGMLERGTAIWYQNTAVPQQAPQAPQAPQALQAPQLPPPTICQLLFTKISQHQYAALSVFSIAMLVAGFMAARR